MATIENPVRIERGTSDDLDAVMEVMEPAFGTQFGEAWTRSQCAGILPMAGVSLTLARDGSERSAAGFSLVRTVADEAELLLLAVNPTHRRRGIGRRLLDDFVDHARSCGARRVHLEVRDGNPAIEMYRSAGFSPIGRRRNYYHARDGRQFDALTFALDL
ncbi:MAG: ribosomal protein S18-alanine N-acetyltransferase [Sphingomicrobium sp.]